MKKTTLLLLIFAVTFSLPASAQIITTIVGTGYGGYSGDNGPAISCELKFPYSTALDAAGNLYIADGGNNCVRKVDKATGIITTIAGTGVFGYNGDNIPGSSATLSSPSSIAFDATGNIYISDNGNHRIRKINSAGIITTVAGTGMYGFSGDNGPATDAQIYSPHGIAFDGDSNLYICDDLNRRIRMVNTSGTITTVVGTGSGGYTGDNGPATAAQLLHPMFLVFDAHGNFYFSDFENNCIRKVNSSGIIITVAGTGVLGYNGDNIPATMSQLNGPVGVAIDANDNIYIADGTNRVRKVNSAGIIFTIAGTGTSGDSGDNGPATSAKLTAPTGVTVDNIGNLYIADYGNFLIRYIKNTVSVPKINNPDQDLTIYPNPSTGNFTIKLSSPSNEPVPVIITNALGEKINETTAAANQPISIALNAPPGIYFLSAATSMGTCIREVIVINKP